MYARKKIIRDTEKGFLANLAKESRRKSTTAERLQYIKWRTKNRLALVESMAYNDPMELSDIKIFEDNLIKLGVPYKLCYVEGIYAKTGKGYVLFVKNRDIPNLFGEST